MKRPHSHGFVCWPLADAATLGDAGNFRGGGTSLEKLGPRACLCWMLALLYCPLENYFSLQLFISGMLVTVAKRVTNIPQPINSFVVWSF